jgi:uncharacterized RDD family membrane protein YckC
MSGFGRKTGAAAPAAFGKKVTPPAGRFAAKSSTALSPEAEAFLARERAARAGAASPTAPEKSSAPAERFDPVAVLTQKLERPPMTHGKPVWGRRIVAMLIDNLIVGLPVLWIFGFGIMGAAMTRGVEAMFAGGLLVLVIWFILHTFYFIMGEAGSKQATLGKRVAGCVVVNLDGSKPTFGTIVLRNTVGRFVANVVPLGVGYFAGIFREDRRCLHDLIASTMVCEKR